MILWALRAMGFLKTGLSVLWVATCKYPLQVALIAALCLAGWQWRAKQEAIAGRAADRAAYAQAQAQAEMAALAAKAETERKYERIADNADKAHARALGDARLAAERYIAGHRVRTQAATCSPGATAATADDQGAGLSEPLPADTIVAIRDSDLRACTDAVIYAVKAHDWATDLGR